jgi:hypothetical protein
MGSDNFSSLLDVVRQILGFAYLVTLDDEDERRLGEPPVPAEALVYPTQVEPISDPDDVAKIGE